MFSHIANIHDDSIDPHQPGPSSRPDPSPSSRPDPGPSSDNHEKKLSFYDNEQSHIPEKIIKQIDPNPSRESTVGDKKEKKKHHEKKDDKKDENKK